MHTHAHTNCAISTVALDQYGTWDCVLSHFYCMHITRSSHALITCSSHALVTRSSNALVTCSRHTLITCSRHMLSSHALVTCSRHMLSSHAHHTLLSHALITCSRHMLSSHALVTCSSHTLVTRSHHMLSSHAHHMLSSHGCTLRIPSAVGLCVPTHVVCLQTYSDTPKGRGQQTAHICTYICDTYVCMHIRRWVGGYTYTPIPRHKHQNMCLCHGTRTACGRSANSNH